MNGQLLLSAKNMRHVVSVEPLCNRMVIFNTNDRTFHGHPEPLNFSEDYPRTSVALYYYTRHRPLSEVARLPSVKTRYLPRHSLDIDTSPGSFRQKMGYFLRRYTPFGWRRGCGASFNKAKCFYRKPVYHRHSRIKYCLLLSRIDKKFQLNFIVKGDWFKKLGHFKSHCQKYYTKCVICSVIKIFFYHWYPLPISQHFAFHNWKCGLLNVGSTFSNSL